VTFSDISGSWSYRVPKLVGPGLSCTIDQLEVTIHQVPGAGDFTGESGGGEMHCTDSSGAYTTHIGPYPIERGYTLDHEGVRYIAFDLYNRDWRHDGRIVNNDSIHGTFTLQNGAVTYSGEFAAVRQGAR
jgi:hypothetical protein